MLGRLFKIMISLLLPGALFAQVEFGYSVSLQPHGISGLPGLHSYAHAQHDGKWLLIGGRLDGIHARQPFNAFPALQNNDSIRVVDPVAGTVWGVSLTSLATGIREQLQATNMQFYQDDDRLVIAGGYAYSSSQADHITFPTLTIVDVPGLVSAIVSNQPIGGYFQQLTDEKFAVTGGYLGKIGEDFYLVGGHRFDGRYNPMGHATYVQTYTDAIRKFRLSNNGGVWSMSDYSVISDPVNLHRRDYNLLPQVFHNGDFGYTIFSGVFQLNQDLPFLYPVDITASGHVPVDSFNQYLCNYHTAHVALYDASANAMHNLFFGGISQYFFADDDMQEDINVPFVKTISRVSRGPDGSLVETRLPIEMPGYLGASAELLLNEELPQAAPGVVNLTTISEDSFLLGYIVGGLDSPVPNAFAFNNTDVTSASTTVYKVFLQRTATTSTQELVLPGYHDFHVRTQPNPVKGSSFRLIATAPEAGTVDVFILDSSGRLLLNSTVEGLKIGENTLEVELKNPAKGMAAATVILNGKYTAASKIYFE